MTDEELKAKVAELEAVGIEVHRPVKEYRGWYFGERATVSQADEDRGHYAGDEGVVVIEEVGAPEHGNVRIDFSFIADGNDSGNEIDPNDLEKL